MSKENLARLHACAIVETALWSFFSSFYFINALLSDNKNVYDSNQVNILGNEYVFSSS